MALRWLTRALGGSARPPEQIRAAIEDAVRSCPAALGGEIDYRADASGGAVVLGTVRLVDGAGFEPVLLAVARALGREGRRTAIYLEGVRADDARVRAEDCGLRPRPTGTEVLEHLGRPGRPRH